VFATSLLFLGFGRLGSYVMLRRYESSCTTTFSSSPTHDCHHLNTNNTTDTSASIIHHPSSSIQHPASSILHPASSIQHSSNPSTMTATSVFTAIAGVLALVGAYFYFFGIDPQTKRQLELQALKTMGEVTLPWHSCGTLTDCRRTNCPTWPRVRTCHVPSPISTTINTSQTRSTESRPRTKRTSSNSRRPSATPSVASRKTQLVKSLVRKATSLQVP
jgi:hypothetical protein